MLAHPFSNILPPLALKYDIIPISSYIKDAKNRWKIHQYEIKELSKDIRWGYNKAEPFVRKVIARLSPKAS